jgi:hypothetical protein
MQTSANQLRPTRTNPDARTGAALAATSPKREIEMAAKDGVKMAVRVLQHHGLDYEIKRGRHVKLVVEHAGQRRTLVTGATPSDRRATLNLYADIRRAVTSLGVEFQDCKALMFN